MLILKQVPLSLAAFFALHHKDLKRHLRSQSAGVRPSPRVLSSPFSLIFVFPGQMLRSDEHHPSRPPHGFPSATTPSGRAAAAAPTPRPAGYCSRRAGTTFPPPRRQQLMTAAISKIKQETISIGDVVADSGEWSAAILSCERQGPAEMLQGNGCLRSLSCGGGTRACFFICCRYPNLSWWLSP